MNSNKNNGFNGVMQILNTAFDSIRNKPEMSKVTFSVKSNGMVVVLVLPLMPKDFVWVAKI